MSTTAASVRVDSPTEGRNPRTLEIDTLSSLGVLELLNDEDARVAAAVRMALPQLAIAVDAAVARWEAGGSIHYFGAGIHLIYQSTSPGNCGYTRISGYGSLHTRTYERFFCLQSRHSLSLHV